MTKPRTRRRRRFLLWLILLSLPFVAGAIYARTPGGRAAIDAWAERQGHHRFTQDRGFVANVLAAPWRRLASPRAPVLAIELKAKDHAALVQMRARALQKGLIEDDEQASVPASFRVDGGRPIAGELRLKGDFTDHLSGDKWSLRIELDEPFLGMRRFSVQDPATKGFQGERLFFWLLGRQGVITPRYEVARVWLAGRDLGVMAVEEHIGDDLMSHNGRGPGVVVHYDETMVFHGRDDYRETSVIAFSQRRLQRDPVLAAALPHAIECLRAFTDGERSVGDTFNAAAMGALFATCEWLGSWHALRWHNLRFAYDAAADRLTPVAFDGNLHMARLVDNHILFEEELAKRLRDDDQVHAAYVAAHERLLREVLEGDLLAALAAEEAHYLPFLQREFTLLGSIGVERLRGRAQALRARGPERRPQHGDYMGPSPVVTYLPEGDGERTLVLRNGHSAPVRVLALRWVPHGGGDAQEPAVVGGGALPLGLPPRSAASRSEVIVRVQPPRNAQLGALEVQIEGHGDTAWQRAVINTPPVQR